LRKRWPSIDGVFVPIVVVLCTAIAALASYYRSSIPVEVWIAVGPLVAAVMATGTVQTLYNAAGKSTTRVIEWHQEPDVAATFPTEAPTKKEPPQ
jgi:hypothetical protein